MISVVIPVHNGAKTIGKCLDAAFASDYKDFEIVAVDDRSSDGSAEIIEKFPCKLVRLNEHSGASKARNIGAQNASGEALFFIDSDCILEKNTLSVAAASFRKDAITGGTYAPLSYDGGFFSDFQAAFVNYFETKSEEPDYIATHAMLISKMLFLENGGFPEKFLPIIEDVEFSHRLRRNGIRLVMNPAIQVRHVFGFNLIASLKNAFRKSHFWTVYSVRNKDLTKDSGTASVELKATVLSWLLCIGFMKFFILSGNPGFLAGASAVAAFNLYVNRGFIGSLFKTNGAAFAIRALLYYLLIYPAPVFAGGITGLLRAAKR